MAPIHHHFELMGWSESKIIVRFWIASLVFCVVRADHTEIAVRTRSPQRHGDTEKPYHVFVYRECLGLFLALSLQEIFLSLPCPCLRDGACPERSRRVVNELDGTQR